jgi:hypothetical protein
LLLLLLLLLLATPPLLRRLSHTGTACTTAAATTAPLLSLEATIGVGVAAGVVGIAIIVVLIFFVCNSDSNRSKRKTLAIGHRASAAGTPYGRSPYSPSAGGVEVEVDGTDDESLSPTLAARSRKPRRRRSSASSTASGAGGGGAENKGGAGKWTPDPQTMTTSDFRRAVEAFFQKHSPKKLGTVPKIVKAYDKKRARLWDKLFATYKAVPDCISPDGVFQKSRREGANGSGANSASGSPRTSAAAPAAPPRKARPYSPRRPSYSASKVMNEGRY